MALWSTLPSGYQPGRRTGPCSPLVDGYQPARQPAPYNPSVDSKPSARLKRIYVCHPFAYESGGDMSRLQVICQLLDSSGYIPLAPQLYLHDPPHGAASQAQRGAVCKEMLYLCDEVRVYGDIMSHRMKAEIEGARAGGIPVWITPQLEGWDVA